jgi:hypothetical protein
MEISSPLIEQKATAVLIVPVNGCGKVLMTLLQLILSWSTSGQTRIQASFLIQSPIKIAPNVWWHCNRCGNDYQAVIYARANGRICPFCIAKRLKSLRERQLAQLRTAEECTYLLPQLAAIYYAGQHELRVITDSEEPVGLPIAALIPEISLAIDVCGYEKEAYIKEYICKVNGITYICLPPKLPEDAVIARIQKAFFDAHIYSRTSLSEDLEIIKQRYNRWKNSL